MMWHTQKIWTAISPKEIVNKHMVRWDDPEGWDGEGGGRWVQDGEHVHPWRIPVNAWQNHYSIVK